MNTKIDIPKLKAVVCGMEHAGTTLLSQLLRQHPLLETGYEVGALMHPTLNSFWLDSGQWKQYRDSNYKYGLEQGWQLDHEGRKAIRKANDWASFYEILATYSPLVRDKSAFLIDKTPPYQAIIDHIAARFAVQIVIIVKDPVLLFDSWAKRRHTSVMQFCRYYKGRADITQQAVMRFPKQVMVIAYEDLIDNLPVVMEGVYQHIGIEPMLYGDRIESDFPEKVPDILAQDIPLRVSRVGHRRGERIRRLTGMSYLSADGSVQNDKKWWG